MTGFDRAQEADQHLGFFVAVNHDGRVIVRQGVRQVGG